ncbi:GlcNAc-transferase family protein [Klebsiella aerogenes]|uniref:GlcNAc-transferase family protein n=1 Tax=Klebsiella aerogenes TaxID=548 RepID=UPI002E354304|nr:GlcNAc-transferase family protein [Klebsiella aerogenes]MED7793097.1 GlcNAc-transferase family protein [Klebsiella aerogenes]
MQHHGNKIFISIASYRDSELHATLQNLVQNATRPENLHIGVCVQDEALPIFESAILRPGGGINRYPVFFTKLNNAKVSIIFMHYSQSRGAGFARHLCETRYENEDYFLQIDSHCRFIPGWDEEMIAMLESLRPLSDKPVLSTYPPDYQPGEPERRADFTSRLVFKAFMPDGIVLQDSRPFQAPEPQRNCYLAGGFVFADGHYVKHVPNDPNIFFYGEEISMAVRAYTHGYDAYTPHKILLWHHYGRSGSPKIWDDHTATAKTKGEVTHTWSERDHISKQRILAVLGLREPLEDIYGRGLQRSLADYTRVSGLCFQSQRIHPDVKGQKYCSFFWHHEETDEMWLEGFISPG